MELIYFILCAYGITTIVVYSHVFKFIREPVSKKSDWLCELVHCPMCMGFWVGVFLCGINKHTELFNFDCTLVTAFICGCISAGTSYLINMMGDDYGIRLSH